MKRIIMFVMLALMGFQLTNAMSTSTTLRSYYDILGVDRHASKGVIRKAYVKLAGENHSDKLDRLPVAERLAREEKFKQVTDAYDTLKDPALKAAYDLNWDSIKDEEIRRRNVQDVLARQERARHAEAEKEAAEQRKKEKAARESGLGGDTRAREAAEAARRAEEVRRAERAKKYAEEQARKREEEDRKAREDFVERQRREAAERARRAAEDERRAREELERERRRAEDLERTRREADERRREAADRTRRAESPRRRSTESGFNRPDLTPEQNEAVRRERARLKAEFDALLS